eukprot:3606817-Alexandrium_andersonii.AAC.1
MCIRDRRRRTQPADATPPATPQAPSSSSSGHAPAKRVSFEIHCATLDRRLSVTISSPAEMES